MIKKSKKPDQETINKFMMSDAAALKSIGHYVRLKLLLAIYLRNCIVTGLVDCVKEPQPIVSQQLAVLRKQGIIKGDKDGNKIVYRIINPLVLETIKILAVKYDN